MKKENKTAMNKDKELEKMDLAKTVAKGSFVNIGSNSLIKILGIVFYFLVLRLLPPEEAGIFFIAFAIFGFAKVIPSLGIPTSINRFVPYYIGKGKKEKVRPLVKKFGAYLLILSIFSSLLLLLLSGSIAQIYGEPALHSLILLITTSIPFALFFDFFLASLRGIKRFISSSIAAASNSIIKVLVLAFAIYFVSRTSFNSFLSITIAFIITTIIMGVWTFLKYKKFPKGKLKKEDTKGIFSYGIPMYISGLGTLLSNWTDTLVLGFFMTNPIVAAYNAIALIARNVGPVVSLPLSQIMQPIFANLHGKGKGSEENFRSLAKYYNKWALILGLPVLIVFTILSYQIMHVIFPAYEEYHWLLWIMAPTFFITLIAAPFRDALWAIGRSDIFMASSLIIIIPNLALNWILIPIYGVLGAAVASAVTYIIAQSIFIYYGTTRTKIWFHKNVLKIAGIALISAVLLFGISEFASARTEIPAGLFNGLLYLIVLVLPMLIIYFGLLYFVIGISNIEKKLINILCIKSRIKRKG